MPYLSIFHQKSLIWLFLGKNLKKPIAKFEIDTFKFVNLQNFTKKNEKCLTLAPKMPSLCIFALEF